MTRIGRGALGLLAAMLLGGGAPALGAPQVLALVSTAAPVPMPCLAGECAVELSAFCLQQGREIPDKGDRYRAHGEGFRLIVVGADGRARSLPAAEHVAILAERGQTAVRVTLPARTLAALGGVRAAIAVADGVSLVPAPELGDPSPQTPEEIATATGPLRRLGSAIVDHGGPEADAARIAAQTINRLPAAGRIAAEAARGALDEAEASVAGGAEARALGRALFAHCRSEVDAGRIFSMRRCLERAHDQVLRDLNLRYWQAVVGS